MNQKKTDRLGVSKLEYFFSSCGWLFREQHIHDHGIDAQVEIVKDDFLTGDLIAIQIKSGSSFFKEQTDDAYVFRTDEKHIHYWCKYSLPVIMVLYHPATEKLYWESINNNTVLNTGVGWKINIPKTKLLTIDSMDELENLIQPLPYIQRLNKLRFDKPWIDLVDSGELVTINFLDWVNKSLSRYQITITCESRGDIENERWPTVYAPGSSIEEFLSNVIPWATFEVDEDEHRESLESAYDAECYMMYDKEDRRTIYTRSFEDWYEKPNCIVPIDNNGEVEHYRLILTLNKLGKSFLTMNEYLTDENDYFQNTFSLPGLDPPGTIPKKMD